MARRTAAQGSAFAITRTEPGGGTIRWFYRFDPGPDGTTTELGYKVLRPVQVFLHLILRALFGVRDLRADLQSPSPVAAFAGLSVGLLVVTMTLQRRHARVEEPRIVRALVLAPPLAGTGATEGSATGGGPAAPTRWPGEVIRHRNGTGPRPGLLRDARFIYQDAAARGERLSQRALARQLRGHGHRFPNEHLRLIAHSIGLATGKAA